MCVTAAQRINSNVGRLIQRLDATQADYSWVAPENLHVTLNFVGDLVDREVPEFCQLMTEAIRELPPFDLGVAGLGAFASIEEPRTIYLGVNEGQQPLAELHDRIQIVLSDWGFNKPRHDYLPHMTIGRVRRGGKWNEKLTEVLFRHRNHEAGYCSVDSVIINSSDARGGDPRYARMATIRLEG